MRWIPLLLLLFSCQYKAPAADSGADEELRGDAGVFPDADDTGGDSGPGDTDAGGTGDASDVDGDGDGYTGGEGDCDDGEPSVFPGADELCDELDNDCDDVTDEEASDAQTFYADADGDGFGDPGAALSACQAPEGYTTDSGDCDDDPVTGGAINPDAAELCDGVDNNCDEVTDGPESGDAGTWYADDDRDGYGDASAFTRDCAQPEGYTDDSSDCDDTESGVYPGADEYCDTYDNDCDFAVDEDAVGDATWYQDSDGDGYGTEAATLEACEQPPGYALNADDCDDDPSTGLAINPGADELCDGVDNNCDGAVDVGAIDAGSWYADGDEDGYGDPDDSLEACEQPEGYTSAADGRYDCDDADPGINPARAEACDGVDQDCDDAVDEDAADPETWYRDFDEDGYGDPDSSAQACEQPEGYTGDNSDCDDGDGAINPEGQETCDAVDQDCDGGVDEDPADAEVWYHDYDGDGFGDPEDPASGCSQPDDHVSDDRDCDDNDPAVSPDGDELCDEVDQDCDGDVDENAVDRETWYLDDDGDGYGALGTGQLACQVPEGYVSADLSSFDCDDAEPTTYPGAHELCDEVDQDCDDTVDEDATDAPTWYRDYDSDGYGDPDFATQSCEAVEGFVDASDGAYDCDDTLPSVKPGATEDCDARDDDCDGLIDEDASDAGAWYADEDRDGYGDPGDAVEACLQPAGYAAASDTVDCDDANDTVYPGAIEFCDLEDDDCDGGVDEGSPGLGTWYADGDEDGWGDAGDTLESCSQPEGYVSTAGDCDTADGAVYPGATELCDEVDQDCDEAVDEDAADAPTWYVDFDGDTWGSSASTTAACSQPDGFADREGDCLDTDGATNPGAEELCDAADQDCDEAVDEDAADAPTWYYDADGDEWGVDDDTVVACERPEDYRMVGGDCDDSEYTVNPGRSERCDAVDQDCDGAVDEGEGTCPCEVESYGDHAYLICDTYATWSEAQGNCEGAGYHLVTLDDEDENLWLDGVLDTYGDRDEWWMGYTDQGSEGDWYWEDGSDSTFTEWHSGEPNNSGNEDCGELRRWDDESWNDDSCGGDNYFVCESG